MPIASHDANDDINQLDPEYSGLILDALEKARIASIAKTEHGYLISEQCDGWFILTLNQQQMEQFIEELQELLEM